MAFALRTVAQRAAGGEILRATRLDQPQLTIGRAADRDVRLQDLSVNLQHAVLRQTGPGAAQVMAEGDDPFELDGAFVREALLDLSTPRRLGFGAYTLMVERDAENDDDIAVTVTRSGAGQPDVEAAEAKSFSLASAGLSKRRIAWTLTLAILLLGLLIPIGLHFSRAHIRLDQQWSSGHLSKAHAFLQNDCAACHRRAFVAVEDSACEACHAAGPGGAVKIQAATRNGVWRGPAVVPQVTDHADHARLAAAAPLPRELGPKIAAAFSRTFHHSNDRCASCHLEHAGNPEADKARRAGEPVSPTADGPATVMAHGCVDCHSGLRRRLTDTALLDVTEWRRHPEFKAQVTQAPVAGTTPVQRISLGQRPQEHTGVTFSHALHLARDGGVAHMAVGLGGKGPLECAACHRPRDGGRDFAPVEMERDCAGCHSLAIGTRGGLAQTLPHGDPAKAAAALRAFYAASGEPSASLATRGPPRFVAGGSSLAAERPLAQRVSAVLGPGGVCAECHQVSATQDPATLAHAIAPVHLTKRYLPMGGFDHSVPAHRRDAFGRATCATCHAARASQDSAEVMIPRIYQCAQCHGRTAARSRTAASAECRDCHSYHAPGDAADQAAARARRAGVAVSIRASWGPGSRG